jgi:hypothetical protein
VNAHLMTGAQNRGLACLSHACSSCMCSAGWRWGVMNEWEGGGYFTRLKTEDYQPVSYIEVDDEDDDHDEEDFIVSSGDESSGQSSEKKPPRAATKVRSSGHPLAVHNGRSQDVL